MPVDESVARRVDAWRDDDAAIAAGADRWQGTTAGSGRAHRRCQQCVGHAEPGTRQQQGPLSDGRVGTGYARVAATGRSIDLVFCGSLSARTARITVTANKKFFIRTFGCQMNEYDSGKMADILQASDGLVPTSDVAQADVILFNTCSVREKAQEKVFSDLGRVKHLKQSNPNLLIGVGGCVASQEGASIVARAPYVDLVFGPQTLHRLPEL